MEKGDGLRMAVRGWKQEARLRLRGVRLPASELNLNLNLDLNLPSGLTPSLSLPIGVRSNE